MSESTEIIDPAFADLAAYRSGQVEPVKPAEQPAETPEEQPAAEAQAETPQPDAEAEPDPASDAGKALAKKKSSLQARIDEEVRKRGEAERRAAQLEAELTAARGAAKPEQPAAEGAAAERKRIMALPGAPKVDQFESYEEFLLAAADFVSEVRLSERDARQQAEAQGRGLIAARDRVEAAVKAAHPDFDEVIEAFAADGHAYAPPVAEFILAHPEGHEIAYALAKDPALNARIAALQHPAAIVFELGKVLAGLEAASAKPVQPEPKPRPVTRAPAPVSTVGSGAGTVATPDPATMSSVAEWRKIRGQY